MKTNLSCAVAISLLFATACGRHEHTPDSQRFPDDITVDVNIDFISPSGDAGSAGAAQLGPGGGGETGTELEPELTGGAEAGLGGAPGAGSSESPSGPCPEPCVGNVNFPWSASSGADGSICTACPEGSRWAIFDPESSTGTFCAGECQAHVTVDGGDVCEDNRICRATPGAALGSCSILFRCVATTSWCLSQARACTEADE